MITEDISQIPQSKDSLPQSSQYLVIYGRLASWRLVLEIIIIFLKYVIGGPLGLKEIRHLEGD